MPENSGKHVTNYQQHFPLSLITTTAALTHSLSLLLLFLLLFLSPSLSLKTLTHTDFPFPLPRQFFDPVDNRQMGEFSPD